MQSIEEIGKILFNNEYWKGGNGGNFKAPHNSGEPKPFQLVKQYRYICGVIQPYVIMVDYDSTTAFECRLRIAIEQKQNCIVIKSPNKGGHFYWFNTRQIPIKSNSGNKTLLTLSPVDYKAGIRKIESTGEIKRARCAGSLSTESGELREILYCSIKEDGTLDEIPFYDFPLHSGDKFNFIDMMEGDGRQDSLFTYMNPIKAAGYSYEQFKEIAELTEKYLFSVPLGEEFENAIRKEAWDSINCSASQFGTGGNFQHNKFADYLIEKHHIKKINGQLHIFCDGVYMPGDAAIESVMLDEIESLRKRQRNEVLDYMRLRAKDYDMGDFNKIAFNNGVYDIETDQLGAFNPTYIITNKIPWDYNPDAESELVDGVLDKISCYDKEIRYLLEEVAGACLYRSCNLGGGMAAFLVGDKHNGKSTYIRMLQSMLGMCNYSALDVKEVKDRFSTYAMYGMLANFGDDISGNYIEDTATFKKLCTGDVIKAEEKGKPIFMFVSYAMQVYSANGIPKMNDPTGAAQRRMLLIPFNANFTKDSPDYDPFIEQTLKKRQHVEYFIQLALDGLAQVLENKSFTIPAKVQKEKDDYRIENNPLLAFIEDCKNDCGEIDGIFNEPTGDVFKRYEVFCSENGFKPLSKLTFSKRINQELGTESRQKKINGKNIKIFVLVSE